MKTIHSCSISLVIAAATVLLATHAGAATPQEAAAEMRFQEAKALMEQGNFAAACPKLVESQRLDPAVGTLLYLGECYDRSGRTATAWATFLAAADAAHSVNQPDRERTARERANGMFAQVSKLTVTVAPEARVPGLEVKVNGTVLGQASWGVATALDPGDHLLEVNAPDRKPWSSRIRVLPGGVRSTIAIPVLEPKTAVASSAPPAMPPVQPAAQNKTTSDWTLQSPAPPRAPEADSRLSDGSTQRLIGITAGGVGVAGIVVGTIFGLVAKSKESDSAQYCLATDNTSCHAQGVAMIKEATRDATIANVSFVVGGLGLVSGAVIYLTAPQPIASKRTTQVSNLRIAPMVAPTTTGFAIAGAF